MLKIALAQSDSDRLVLVAGRIAHNCAFVAWLEAVAVGFLCTNVGCSQANSKAMYAPLPAGTPAVGHRVPARLKHGSK